MKNEIITKKDQVNFSKSKGFTLVETLVAIFVLVIAVTGPMSAVVSSLKASFLARDQVVAFYLAQDVIEAIKNVRDKNYINNIPKYWLDGILPACLNTENECSVDTSGLANSSNLSFQNNCNDCELYLKNISVGTVFTYNSSGTKTKYSRKVYFEIIQPNELKIKVEIEWSSRFGGTTKKIVVQENIYNWLGLEEPTAPI